MIIGFSAVSTILAIFVSIEGYEQFLFLIGALFIPLFGVLLTDYFVISRGRYQHDMMYGNKIIKIGYPAIVAWFVSEANCVDCRLRNASNVKPSYW